MNAMKKYSIWKWGLLVVLVASSMLIVFPGSTAKGLREWLKIKGGIRLGLDISGGTSFTLEIDRSKVDIKAVEERIRQDKPGITTNQLDLEVEREIKELPRRALETIRNRVDLLGIAEPVIFLQEGKSGTKIIVQLPGIDDKKRQEAEEVLKSAAYLEFRLVHARNKKLLDKLFTEACKPPFGFLKVADTDGRYYVENLDEVPQTNRTPEFVANLKRYYAPVDADFMLERKVEKGTIKYLPCFVEKKVQLVGSGIRTARRELDTATGRYSIGFQLNPEAKKKFATLTTKHAEIEGTEDNRSLAIILDGVLQSAPNIRTPITDGSGEITGAFDYEESTRLATVLQSGSLDAPIMIGEKRIVDPTLGADAVHNGVLAGVLGCVAIIVLMAGYYMIPGLLADFSLCLNIILLPLGMIVVAGFLGVLAAEARAGEAIALPVLTLPGIAGIALTIGMAVDANVLIFERMREELRTGKGFGAVVQAGFERAFSAIFDSNLTTIITAVILFVFGSGAVRGYAVTLAGGLIISLFTAVVVTRMSFNLIGTRTEKLSVFRMLSAVKQTNIDFIRWWKPAIGISALIIVGSWAVMVFHLKQDNSKVLGVDFTGGTSLTVSFDSSAKPDVEALRRALDAAGISDASIQYQKSQGENIMDYLQIRVAKLGGEKAEGQAATTPSPVAAATAAPAGTGETAQSDAASAPAVASTTPAHIEQDNAVMQILKREFPTVGFKLLQQDFVGAQVSKDLGKNARNAMVLSLIAMVIYIALRFKFGFALGAVVALFHDVIITAGLTHLLGFQINMTVLAALMTIVGYSVNDTIVIFDRVREDLRLYKNKTFVEICNQAMNETLSRTLLTNFLTFVSVLFLLVLGGQALRDFSVAMFIGMIAGTYSTMYIATPVVLMWYRYKRPDLGTVARIG